MFRHLIPQLEDRFHVIAPDYIGFGYSAAPSSTEFKYTQMLNLLRPSAPNRSFSAFAVMFSNA
jgi:pimeloyl-ACP methyl ester carboxylesterase